MFTLICIGFQERHLPFHHYDDIVMPFLMNEWKFQSVCAEKSQEMYEVADNGITNLSIKVSLVLEHFSVCSQ